MTPSTIDVQAWRRRLTGSDKDALQAAYSTKEHLTVDDAINIVATSANLQEAVTLLGRLPVLIGKGVDAINIALPGDLRLKVSAGKAEDDAQVAWNEVTFSSRGAAVTSEAALEKLSKVRPMQLVTSMRTAMRKTRH